jgi:predicted metal-dependent phosphoesterase TrpH
LIDLHTHTNQSDGTTAPEELVAAARAAGLSALAITDHDTFGGYLLARPAALEQGLELVCGIELSTRTASFPVHLLGYFLNTQPTSSFTNWLTEQHQARHQRNLKLAARLQALRLDVTLEEAKALGSGVTGRVHFARVMIAKGYVHDIKEAFNRYLAEGAPAYVAMEDVLLDEAIPRMREAGGLPVIAHPGRMRLGANETEFIRQCADRGLAGLEVIHSDHSLEEALRYQRLAREFGLAMTGGSDFHGDNKPRLKLGSGYEGNVRVPDEWLQALRELARN